MIRLMNKRTYKGTGIYIGRGTPAGNPFVMQDGSDAERERVINKYKEGVHEHYQYHAAFRNMIDGLVMRELAGKDTVLICWCAPKPCHGDVIIEVVMEAVRLVREAD